MIETIAINLTLGLVPFKYWWLNVWSKLTRSEHRPIMVTIPYRALDMVEFHEGIYYIDPPLKPEYEEALKNCNGEHLGWWAGERNRLRALFFRSESDLIAFKLVISDYA